MGGCVDSFVCVCWGVGGVVCIHLCVCVVVCIVVCMRVCVHVRVIVGSNVKDV